MLFDSQDVSQVIALAIKEVSDIPILPRKRACILIGICKPNMHNTLKISKLHISKLMLHRFQPNFAQ